MANLAAAPLKVLVPDIGGFKDVSVIEVLVKDGQQIDKETPMITIESEKAAMDVPAPVAGRVQQVKVKPGDKVSEGSLILLLEARAEPDAGGAGAASATSTPATARRACSSPRAGSSPPRRQQLPRRPARRRRPRAAAPARGSGSAAAVDEAAFSRAYASPSVRKFARELGADLGKVTGTGPKGRITQEDVKAYVKRILTARPRRHRRCPRWRKSISRKFGAVEIKPLSRIQRISGARLQASWLNLPHVTQHEDADITDLEIARVA